MPRDANSLVRVNASPRSYATDAEGGKPVAVRMRIAGSLAGDYVQFVGERAGWLSLSGWASSQGPGRVEVVAAGPEALVGALEMACLLGPLGALIDTIAVEPESGPVPAGFTIR